MKHLKMLGLAAMALAAFMAFAGSASAAPTLTSPAGTAYTGEMSSTVPAGGTLLLKAGFANITCTESTVAGAISTNTEAEATGNISTLEYKNCVLAGSTTKATVTTITKGSLTILPSGAVSGSGSEVTTGIASLGTSCVYGTKTGTSLGTLTGGTPAKMTISAQLPLVKTAEGFGCASPAEWSGSYTVTKPSTLLLG